MNCQSEYKRTPCLYCGKRTLRAKQDNDWHDGEKTEKGYHPLTLNYWYCDSCKRSSVSNKEVIVIGWISIITLSQYMLWWFQYVDKR